MSDLITTGTVEDPMVPLNELSAALDEIYRLRVLMAQQSLMAKDHSALASLSPKRRAALEESAKVMTLAAQGRSTEAYEGLSASGQTMLRGVGAKTGLSRASFAQEQREEQS